MLFKTNTKQVWTLKQTPPVIWIFTGIPNGTSPTVLPPRSELDFPSVNFSVMF